MKNTKLIRITTVPLSLKILLRGQHRFMSSNGFEVLGVSSQGTELQDVHQTEHIRVEALEMTRTISPIKDLKALWQFYRLCKNEKPTMVHSHTPKAGIVGMLGAKLAGVPIRLHTVAGMPLMEATGIKRKILDFVEKLTYSAATKVYPNSKGLYDFILQNNYTQANKLKVIANGSSNGIDTTFFAPEQVSAEKQAQLKQDLGIQPDDFVFIFVGRLVGDKGLNELIQAFSKIKDENVKLLLVGPFENELDPLKPETISEIKDNPNIVSVGYQKDVRKYYAISNVLVFPSYREGFPNVVLQAGAMQLPSIVTNINGSNEIITHNKNGLIIPVQNSDAIFAAMLFMMNENIEDMSMHARIMVENRYKQQLVWESLLKEYKELQASVR